LLLSTWNGAFVWSPVLLLGLLGPRWIPDRHLRRAAFLTVILEVYISSLLGDWWGGRAFGARRLVSLAPLAGLGVALTWHALAQTKRRWAAGLVILVTACSWNLRLAMHQAEGRLPWNPGNARDYVRFYDPNSRHATRYGLWDYPRLVEEFVAAERMARLQARR
jgi:hypothetical protein